MKGSVFTKIAVWQVTRRGTVARGSKSIEYGHSATSTLNTSQQRDEAFQRSINQCLTKYRHEHGLDSDAELNYTLINSGIINTIKVDGKRTRRIHPSGISAARKRTLHKTVYLGREDKHTTKKEYNNMFKREKTAEEIEGEKNYNKRFKRAERKKDLIHLK